ncbi:COG1086 Predicted nucleoside-diphosphate sugar epimerases [Candidatus Pelagibacterales bacterium]
MEKKTIIFGKRSNLTNFLLKTIEDSIAFSSLDKNNISLLNKCINPNIIINQFYPSFGLSEIKDYKNFYELSIIKLSEIIDFFKDKKINKIIYTSSSSIYGSLGDINNFGNNRDLYSSTKLACENLIKNFSRKNKSDFIITRIFNMYGGEDKFSLIAKILESIRNNNKFIIYNNGSSVRDFIHVSDVSSIYKKLISYKFSGIVDIGTGQGVRIKDLLESIIKPKIKIFNDPKFSDEIETSIANNQFILNNLKYKNFISLKNFFLKEKIFVDVSKLNFLPFNQKNNLERYIDGSLIYGAGYAGKKIYLEFSKNNNKVYGFIDDNFDKIGKNLYGKKVYSLNYIESLSKSHRISNIVIAIPSISDHKKDKLIKKLIPLADTITALPEKQFLTSKKIEFNDIQDINYENILGKKSDTINFNKNYFKDYVILVTGAGGTIGSNLTSELNKNSFKKLILFDHDETALFNINRKFNSPKVIPILGSLNNISLIKNIIDTHKVTHIYHAAAYKHVSMLEDNIHTAIDNNVFCTINLIKSLNKNVRSLTIISTDKATRPKSILGMSKRISEILAQTLIKKLNPRTNLSIVRFGNVFASQGSLIEILIDQIKKGQTINITSKNAERYFMSAEQACKFVIASTFINSKDKILIFNMGKPVKIFNLVNSIIRFMNLDPRNTKINYSGLKKGEKLKEEMSISKKLNKTKYNQIYSFSEPLYNYNSVVKFVDRLTLAISRNNEKLTIKLIKEFLKKELSIKT